MPLDPGEELIESKEGRTQLVLERVERRVSSRARAVRFPGGRGTVAAVVLAVLMADLVVLATRRPLPLSQRDDVGLAQATAGPRTEASLPPVAPLRGKGPFAVYAFEDGGTDHVRVFASDLGASPVAGQFPSVFLGRFPGFITDFAGTQGQAAGTVVPIGTAQETVDATQATRLWLLRKGQTARQLLSTFDFVSAYALNRDGSALAALR